MKNLKRNLSLGLSLLLAAGALAPSAAFATDVKNETKTEVTAKDTETKEPSILDSFAVKVAFAISLEDAENSLKETEVGTKPEDVEIGRYFISEEAMNVFKKAVEDAKAVKEKADAKDEEIKDAAKKLNAALEVFKEARIAGTKTPADPEARIAELEANIAKLNKDLETAGTEKGKLDKQIKEYKAQIESLKKQLAEKQVVNKLFLERVLKTLKTVKKDDLEKEYQDKYTKLLVEAELLYAKKDATQKETDEMASKVLDFLYTAQYQESVATKKELKKVLEDAKKIKERDLARRDWADLQKLIKEADEIVADRKASQRDVDGITKDLDKLIRDIMSYRLDIKDLEKLVEAASKLDAEKLARRDRYEFEKCFAEAKALLRDPGATQREIDRAHDNLKGFLKDVAKDGGKVGDEINKLLNNTGNIDVEKALSRSRALFNLPVIETKTLDSNAKLESLRYVFTLNSERFAEVTNKAINVYKMDTAPFIQNNRTMVPLRYAAYTLQADVVWDQMTKTATFTKNGVSAYVTLGSNLVRMSNGQNFNMDSAPVIRNNRMHVSISNIAKMFGEQSGNYNDGNDNRIEWDATNRAVIVYVAK